MSISWGTQYSKLKTNLQLATNRLKLMERKKTELALKARTEIADYITAQKPDRARIRVEHIIREDFLVEAFELLEMYCDLLLARFGLIEQMKTLDDGIAEAVVSILWAAPRVAQDIAEFKTISEQLTVKYSKVFAESARANQLEYPAKVNPKLMQKLNVSAPPRLLVEKYLIHIAQAARVPFTPDPDVMREDEVAQAEQMLIEFKKNEDIQGGGGGAPPGIPPPPPFFPPGGGGGGMGESYGWAGGVPPAAHIGAGAMPAYAHSAPPAFHPPAPPGGGAVPAYGAAVGGVHPPTAFPPPPYGGGGEPGAGSGGGHSDIYEVPGRKNSGTHYDEVSSQTPISTPTIPPSGFVQLPRIGPDGRPIDPNALPSQYPILSARNSVVDPKPKTSAPSAPIVHDEKDDLAALFPEPPSSMPSNHHGGNNGGGGGLDLDDLTRRFDALKKK